MRRDLPRLIFGAAVALWLCTSWWPTAAAAQRKEGAVQRVQYVPPLATPNIFEKDDLIAIPPWCVLEATDLMPPSCSGSYSCGAASLPCIESIDGGLGLVAAGVGLRNANRATINMRGAPLGSQPVARFLIWAVITRNPEDPLLRLVTFNGADLVGQVLGKTGDPCWDTGDFESTHFLTLWAQVPTAHHDLINGGFEVELYGGSVIDGRSPWNDPNGEQPFLDSEHRHEGASLITIFSHPSVPLEAKVVLHEATDLIIGQATYRLSLPILPSATQVTLLRVAGDGQTHAQGTPVAAFKTSVRFDSGPWVVVAGPGSPINVHGDWRGGDGGSNELWDTRLTQAPAAIFEIAPGIRTYVVSYEQGPFSPTSLALKASISPADCVGQAFLGATFQ